MKAAVYCRKSTSDERSAADGKSVERQRENAVAFAVSRGWIVDPSHIYTDDGISGAEFVNRPGLQALVKAAKSKPKPFGIVVMMETSRLGREQIEAQYVSKQITDAGVRMFTYSDGQEIKLDTAINKVVEGLKHFGNEQEREAARRRVREGARAKAQKGHATSGVVPFGYTLERIGEHVERRVEKSEAEWVVRVFEWAAGGAGDGTIATRLNEAGVRARTRKGKSRDKVASKGRGGRWGKDHITRMLRNSLYVGRAEFGRTTAVDGGGRAGVRVKQTDDAALVVHTDPAWRIVSDELFARVQARKAKTNAQQIRNDKGQLLSKPEAGLLGAEILSGFLRCSECGSSFSRMGNVTKQGPLWYCRGRQDKGCTVRRALPIKLLTDSILDKLEETLFRNPAVVAELFEARLQAHRDFQARQSAGTDRTALEAEADRLQGEIDRLVGALAAGVTSPTISKEIADRETRLGAAKERLASLTATPITFDTVKLLSRLTEEQKVYQLSGRTSPQTCRAALRRLGVERIVVTLTETGWIFEGSADLQGVVARDTSESPMMAL